jgi:Coenzyme PQQ synthesis protein D (PqqD)
LNLDSAYVPRQEVASELIDGEAIIIDLSTGMYFSLDSVGGRIWALLAQQASLEEITTRLHAEYEVDAEVAREDLENLVTQLLSENLIVPAQEPKPLDRVAPTTVATRIPYQPARLEAYRDMGDLLALDPPAPGLSEIVWREGPASEHGEQ